MSDCRIPYCGLCAFFTAECCDGFGYCAITERGCARNNQCDLDHTKMNPSEIVKALHYIQKWRRGTKTTMPKPYVIGKVNDAAIYQLRKQEREKSDAIEEQRKLAEEMKIRRGDCVVLNGVCGEIYGHVERIKQMGQNCLIEFMERRKGHVERYVVPEEDIKLLLGVR